MKNWVTSIAAFLALVGTIVGGLSYFARQTDLEALAGDLKQTSQQVNYQSALRLYEFLVTQHEKAPRDTVVERRMKEAEKRVKALECQMWPESCR